ncbi:MAG: ATP synthase F1 subunit delta [Muribaculaceae bacterium]|nr:ATP synthase F1 subunit delta [Muribaculaceae bacterium]
MNEGLIPRRYAKALYKVAVERGDAQLMYGLMNRLHAVSESEAGLGAAVANPFLSVKDKCDIIKTAAGQGANNATFVDFLKLLSENKRLDIIFAVARDYSALYRSERNIYKVEVVSASPLSPSDETRLKSIIEKNLNGGSMEYTSSVNPDLIGGFTVTIDNRRLDASVRNELKQLRVNLLK